MVVLLTLVLVSACGSDEPQADEPQAGGKILATRTNSPESPQQGVSTPDTEAPPTSEDITESASEAPSSDESEVAPDDNSDGGPDPDSETEEFLLSQQAQLQFGGDGLSPNCEVDEDTPSAYGHDPGIWLHELFSNSDYPRIVTLCLHGFNPKRRIDLRVTAGDLAVNSSLRPVAGAPRPNSDYGYEDAPSTTLFEAGAVLRVYTKGYGSNPIGGPEPALTSEMWKFVPPPRARAAMAEAGSVTITATQRDATATEVHPIAVPHQRSYFTVHTPSGELLVLHGYPAGARVPIGLYRRDDPAKDSATRVRRLDTVRIPASQVATWPLRLGPLADLPPGTYCVIPPIEGPADCYGTSTWPDYPGRVAPGERGSDVKQWQSILIDVGVISDIPDNRDGFYGPKTQAAVEDYLRQERIEEYAVDGILAADLYTRLTGINT